MAKMLDRDRDAHETKGLTDTSPEVATQSGRAAAAAGGEESGDGGGAFVTKVEALARVLLDQRRAEIHKKKFEEMEKVIEQIVTLVQSELAVWQKMRSSGSEPTPLSIGALGLVDEDAVRRALRGLMASEKEIKRVVAISPLFSSSTTQHPFWKQLLDNLQSLVDELKADPGTATVRRKREKAASAIPVSQISYGHNSDIEPAGGPPAKPVASGGSSGSLARVKSSGNTTPRTDSRSELADRKKQSSEEISSSSSSSGKLAPPQPTAERGTVLGRLRSIGSADEAKQSPASRAADPPLKRDVAKTRLTFGRSNTGDAEKSSGSTSGQASTGSDIVDKNRDRFWRNVRNANSSKKGSNNNDEPLVVTLCKQNIKGSLQLLQGDVFSGASVEPSTRAGPVLSCPIPKQRC
jgi:hypothetical protein